MSFYHVLQSNAAADSYPNNNGSVFTTPINNPIHLENKWEVALMSMTYSNCIKTFDNDSFSVTFTKRTLDNVSHPMYLEIPAPATTERHKVIAFYQTFFKPIFGELLSLTPTFQSSFTHITWRVHSEHFFIILSKNLIEAFQLPSGVLSYNDKLPQSMQTVSEELVISKSSITIIPTNWRKRKYVIKEAGEKITPKELENRLTHNTPFYMCQWTFKEKGKRVGLKLSSTNLNTGFIFNFSTTLQNALQFPQRGLVYDQNAILQTRERINLTNMKDEWFITTNYFRQTWPLVQSLNPTEYASIKPCRPTTLDDVISAIHKALPSNDIIFSHKNERILMQIKAEGISITFSNTLRDILAFDENTYKGPGTFTSSDVFSFTRRIQYFYVYSNIGDLIRIGDTEAPLIAVFPFHANSCDVLKEKNFRTPMYVPVIRNSISQIDIGIYDDAGCRVPFADDKVTSLRLHFRRL